MKKKMKKFSEGGFSAAQEEWLGGADRTDPIILARMRAAVPDKAAPVKSMEQAQDEQEGYESASRAPKSVERTVVKTKVTPSKKSEKEEVIKEKVNPAPEEENDYLKRSRSVVEGVKNTANQFTKLRNYDPLQKLGDVLSSVQKWGKTPVAEQAEKFRKASMKKGGAVKVSSASKRGDGCAQRGKTKGRMV